MKRLHGGRYISRNARRAKAGTSPRALRRWRWRWAKMALRIVVKRLAATGPKRWLAMSDLELAS